MKGWNLRTIVICMWQLSFINILLGMYFSGQYSRNRFVLYKGKIYGYQINTVIKCLLNNNKSVSLITFPCYQLALTLLVGQPPNKHICTPGPEQAATDVIFALGDRWLKPYFPDLLPGFAKIAYNGTAYNVLQHAQSRENRRPNCCIFRVDVNWITLQWVGTEKPFHILRLTTPGCNDSFWSLALHHTPSC